MNGLNCQYQRRPRLPGPMIENIPAFLFDEAQRNGNGFVNRTNHRGEPRRHHIGSNAPEGAPFCQATAGQVKGRRAAPVPWWRKAMTSSEFETNRFADLRLMKTEISSSKEAGRFCGLVGHAI